MSVRDDVQRELAAFEGTELAAGAVGYVLVVVGGSGNDPRPVAVGDTISLRQNGLSIGEAVVALELAAKVLKTERHPVVNPKKETR